MSTPEVYLRAGSRYGKTEHPYGHGLPIRLNPLAPGEISFSVDHGWVYLLILRLLKKRRGEAAWKP